MFGILIILAMAVFFYKAADFENLGMPIVWASGSFALSLLTAYWGLCGLAAGQVLLLGWMGVWMHFQRVAEAKRTEPMRPRNARCTGCGRPLPVSLDANRCAICGQPIAG